MHTAELTQLEQPGEHTAQFEKYEPVLQTAQMEGLLQQTHPAAHVNILDGRESKVITCKLA